jgi:hypothetical protein
MQSRTPRRMSHRPRRAPSGDTSLNLSCDGKGSAPSACSNASRFLSSYSLAIPNLANCGRPFALHVPAPSNERLMVNSDRCWKAAMTGATRSDPLTRTGDLSATASGIRGRSM